MKHFTNIIRDYFFDFYEWLKLSFYALFIYLNIDIEVFNILIIFMCVDSLLGAVKSVRLGKDFSFKLLIWGFTLKLFFLIIPLLVALLGKGLGYDFEISVDVVMKVLMVSESFSVFGNIYSIKNKVEVKRIDMISLLLVSIRKVLRSFFNKLIKSIESVGNCKIDEK